MDTSTTVIMAYAIDLTNLKVGLLTTTVYEN